MILEAFKTRATPALRKNYDKNTDPNPIVDSICKDPIIRGLLHGDVITRRQIRTYAKKALSGADLDTLVRCGPGRVGPGPLERKEYAARVGKAGCPSQESAQHAAAARDGARAKRGLDPCGTHKLPSRKTVKGLNRASGVTGRAKPQRQTEDRKLAKADPRNFVSYLSVLLAALTVMFDEAVPPELFMNADPTGAKISPEGKIVELVYDYVTDPDNDAPLNAKEPGSGGLDQMLKFIPLVNAMGQVLSVVALYVDNENHSLEHE